MTGPTKPFQLDGTELAGYRIETLIGRGGMAYVYRAADKRLGRTVALKVLAPDLATDAEFRRRFLRESRLAASIDHPNVIPIYDAGEADGVLYIAMRYVEGSDLKALLIREQKLDVHRAVDIFSQVADALDAAHAHGLVHRDVKPANILISPGTLSQGHEHVYLSDFGVTKRASSKSGVTAAGVIVGTMDYLAPEQISGKTVSARTDVYALGCVIYQALTGSVPFVRDDDAALLWAHLVETLPPISQHRPDLPPAVQDVLLKATAKDPEDRYASCGELLEQLTMSLSEYRPAAREDTAGRYAPPAAMPADRVPRSRTGVPTSTGPAATGGRSLAAVPMPVPVQRSRRGWIWALVASAVVAVLALAGFFLLRPHGPGTAHFAANDVVPVSFDYPADWRQAPEGNNLVLSPHADAFLDLFTRPDQPDPWGKIGKVLREDRDGSIGMYTFFNQIDYSNGDPRQTLLIYLPTGARFTPGQGEAALGNVMAIHLSGVVSDPRDSATQLRFECYIARSGPQQQRNIHMILFSDAKSFNSHQATFDSIVRSAVLPA